MRSMGGGWWRGMKKSVSTTFGAHWFSNFAALSVFFLNRRNSKRARKEWEREGYGDSKGRACAMEKHTCQKDGEVAMTTTYTACRQSCFIGVWSSGGVSRKVEQHGKGVIYPSVC